MKAFALIGAANAIKLTTDRRQHLAQTREYPQPDIRGANPINAHPDSTFSSFNHNDWTNDWRDYNFVGTISEEPTQRTLTPIAHSPLIYTMTGLTIGLTTNTDLETIRTITISASTSTTKWFKLNP